MYGVMVLAAGVVVVLYALYLGKDVKLSLKLLGTAAALEVNGSTRRRQPRDPPDARLVLPSGAGLSAPESASRRRRGRRP